MIYPNARARLRADAQRIRPRLQHDDARRAELTAEGFVPGCEAWLHCPDRVPTFRKVRYIGPKRGKRTRVVVELESVKDGETIRLGVPLARLSLDRPAV